MSNIHHCMTCECKDNCGTLIISEENSIKLVQLPLFSHFSCRVPMKYKIYIYLLLKMSFFCFQMKIFCIFLYFGPKSKCLYFSVFYFDGTEQPVIRSCLVCLLNFLISPTYIYRDRERRNETKRNETKHGYLSVKS